MFDDSALCDDFDFFENQLTFFYCGGEDICFAVLSCYGAIENPPPRFLALTLCTLCLVEPNDTWSKSLDLET